VVVYRTGSEHAASARKQYLRIEMLANRIVRNQGLLLNKVTAPTKYFSAYSSNPVLLFRFHDINHQIAFSRNISVTLRIRIFYLERNINCIYFRLNDHVRKTFQLVNTKCYILNVYVLVMTSPRD
jgi:hypothetical protein